MNGRVQFPKKARQFLKVRSDLQLLAWQKLYGINFQPKDNKKFPLYVNIWALCVHNLTEDKNKIHFTKFCREKP